MALRPSAQGSLAKTPFAHLLLYLESRKLTGTLAIWPEESTDAVSQDRILFDQGQLIAMRSIAPAKTLYAALVPLFARENAPYGFYEGHNLLGQRGPLLQEPIDLYTLLSRGLRTHANDAMMDAVFDRVRGRELRLRSGTPLERLELNEHELALLEPLQSAAATIDGLLGSGALPPSDAKRTLYLLTLVRGLEAIGGRGSIPAVPIESFPPQRLASDTLSPYTLTGVRAPREGQRGRTPVPASSQASSGEAGSSVQAAEVAAAQSTSYAHEATVPAVPPPPVDLDASDEARWNELTALFGRLDELTHYELLNLTNSASAQEIQGAYYARAKRFHPDRLPAPLAPLARVAQLVFDRVNEANGVLSDARARAAYDQSMADGGGTRAAERTMREVLESTLEYQKAEVLVRRREYTQALQLLQSAIAKNADDPDYHALHAWILHLTNPGLPAPFDEMLRALERALKANPRHERAHYYKGVVLKRLGREAQALRHFRAAAEINPHNVDAAREVRLANMRRESKPPPPSSQGGVLSRLFKK